MIQELKPETCINWFCEPFEFVSSEFNKCVLNFGQNIEYPPCNECQEYGSDEDNPRKKGEPTECEMGEGCFNLEKRVRYFLRYAKNHPRKKETQVFAKKLVDILKKQHKIKPNTHLKDGSNIGKTSKQENANLKSGTCYAGRSGC